METYKEKMENNNNKRIIPFSPPDITEVEINYVIDALRSGWITTGERTKLLERRLAAYIGRNRVACLNSQTAAAELTLRLLGIGEGDEVIVPAYTYTATAAVAAHVGAKIVMIDCAPDSFEMDYDAIAGAITERTKVIIPVDLGGKLCDYDRIYAALEAKKALYHPRNAIQALWDRVIVVADSAHGMGAERGGVKSGGFADFTTFSFHAVKCLTTGEGGAVTWLPRRGLDDDEVYRQYMLLSLHGQSKDAMHKNMHGAWEYDVLCTGYKCNMPDTLAAIGLGQLDRYADLLERRCEIVRRYDEAFLPFGIKRLDHFEPGAKTSLHLYLVRVPGIGDAERRRIIDNMASAGVACNVHYKPLPLLTAYRDLGFDIADYPNAWRQYENEITLPLHTKLSDEDVEYIVKTFSHELEHVSAVVKV